MNELLWGGGAILLCPSKKNLEGSLFGMARSMTSLRKPVFSCTPAYMQLQTGDSFIISLRARAYAQERPREKRCNNFYCWCARWIEAKDNYFRFSRLWRLWRLSLLLPLLVTATPPERATPAAGPWKCAEGLLPLTH